MSCIHWSGKIRYHWTCNKHASVSIISASLIVWIGIFDHPLGCIHHPFDFHGNNPCCQGVVPPACRHSVTSGADSETNPLVACIESCMAAVVHYMQYCIRQEGRGTIDHLTATSYTCRCNIRWRYVYTITGCIKESHHFNSLRLTWHQKTCFWHAFYSRDFLVPYHVHWMSCVHLNYWEWKLLEWPNTTMKRTSHHHA